MTQTDILLPMLLLIGWTLCVLGLLPYRRFRAAAAGQVNPGDFRYGESERVPADVRLPNRNLINLFEMPVLFYALSLTAYITATVDPWMLRLAWAYLALRVLHSVVHIGYNNVMHRLTVFALSNGVLLALWLRQLLALT